MEASWVSEVCNYFAPFMPLGDIVKFLVNICAGYGFFIFLWNLRRKKIELSIGSFWISYAYFDVQNITNLVSHKFYDGGRIPDSVRNEIIKITTPNAHHLVINEEALQRSIEIQQEKEKQKQGKN